jgi:hypothetical protein
VGVSSGLPILRRWREFVMGMAFIFLLLVFKFLGGRYK